MVENRNGSKRPSGIIRNDVPSLFSFRLPDSSFFLRDTIFFTNVIRMLFFLRYTALEVMLVIFFYLSNEIYVPQKRGGYFW